MKIKFQADNDLDEDILHALLRLDSGIDFQTSPAAGLHLGTSDDQVLEIAAQQGRVLVTHDQRTMPHHFADFLAGNNSSPGVIIISRKLSIGQAAQQLHSIWETIEAEAIVDSIRRIP